MVAVNKEILIVEDEEDILALLHYNLIKAGYAAVCASRGEEALEKKSLRKSRTWCCWI